MDSARTNSLFNFFIFLFAIFVRVFCFFLCIQALVSKLFIHHSASVSRTLVHQRKNTTPASEQTSNKENIVVRAHIRFVRLCSTVIRTSNRNAMRFINFSVIFQSVLLLFARILSPRFLHHLDLSPNKFYDFLFFFHSPPLALAHLVHIIIIFGVL